MVSEPTRETWVEIAKQVGRLGDSFQAAFQQIHNPTQAQRAAMAIAWLATSGYMLAVRIFSGDNNLLEQTKGNDRPVLLSYNDIITGRRLLGQITGTVQRRVGREAEALPTNTDDPVA